MQLTLTNNQALILERVSGEYNLIVTGTNNYVPY